MQSKKVTKSFRKFLFYLISLKLLHLLLGRLNNMFNENSMLTRVWFGAVMAGTYPYRMVPDLSNLREEVGKKLTEIGYDIAEAPTE